MSTVSAPSLSPEFFLNNSDLYAYRTFPGYEKAFQQDCRVVNSPEWQRYNGWKKLLPSDKVEWQSQSENPADSFSIFRAGGKLLKGAVINPIQSLVSFKGLLGLAVFGLASRVFGKNTIPVFLGLGLLHSGYHLATGLSSYLQSFFSGNSRQAENAFESIGTGLVTGLLSVLGARQLYKIGKPVTGSSGPESFSTQVNPFNELWANAKSGLLGIWPVVTSQSFN